MIKEWARRQRLPIAHRDTLQAVVWCSLHVYLPKPWILHFPTDLALSLCRARGRFPPRPGSPQISVVVVSAALPLPSGGPELDAGSTVLVLDASDTAELLLRTQVRGFSRSAATETNVCIAVELNIGWLNQVHPKDQAVPFWISESFASKSRAVLTTVRH